MDDAGAKRFRPYQTSEVYESRPIVQAQPL